MTAAVAGDIRPARRGDLERVLAIQRAAYGLLEAPLYGTDIPPLRETLDDLAPLVAAGGLWVGEDDAGRVTGSVRLEMLSPAEGHLFRLSVDPSRHGSGWGRRLFRAGEAEIGRRGAGRVRIEVGVDSAALRRMYERWGYEYTGEVIPGIQAPTLLVMNRGL